MHKIHLCFMRKRNSIFRCCGDDWEYCYVSLFLRSTVYDLSTYLSSLTGHSYITVNKEGCENVEFETANESV